MKIVVTGGAGFIGSALVRHLIGHTDHEVLVVDKLTYAGNLASLASVQDHPRYQFSRTDICDRLAVPKIFSNFDPDAVMHLAAESHVDRSIAGPDDFINTNVVGLCLCSRLRSPLAPARCARKNFRFLHVSTDEVWCANR
jgi:dTDP-glucose 4,6-dehydratase